VKYARIEQHRDDHAASRMCRLLAVSRTGLCAMPLSSARRTVDVGQCPRIDFLLTAPVCLRPISLCDAFAEARG
jgi:hypothetical protein